MNINDYYLWTAVITPFNESEEVDYESLAMLLKRQEEAGNGILILGSTGENLSLSIDEKKEIVDFTERQKLNVPVMCGVGGTNFKESKSWILYLNEKKIDVYLTVAPLYTKPGPKGQYKWFRELLDCSDKPCMIYNVPSRTGKKIEQSAVSELSSHEKFWAIKEASGSLDEFMLYKNAVKNQLVYSGDDGMLPDYTATDVNGLVSVIANVWPKETNFYVKKCLSKEIEGLTPLWKDISDALFVVSNPIPVKLMLNNMGIISSPKLRLPLTHTELDDLSVLEEADRKVKLWYEKNREEL